MPADAPTILATSGGIRDGRRTRWEFSALTDYAIELSGVSGREPRVCLVATALGDNPAVLHHLYEAAQARGVRPSHLTLFPMPNVDDITAHLLRQDVVWVFGGSVAGLLAMWRLHGVDVAMRIAWQAGVVLTGVSAGSICWHVGGTTDSFGPDLRPVTDGLALVKFSNGVHYDSEPQRRPLFQRLIADGTLPDGYATDDGAGVLYRGADFVEAVSEREGAAAYFVAGADGDSTEEVRLGTRRL
jgi:peptidase E